MGTDTLAVPSASSSSSRSQHSASSRVPWSTYELDEEEGEELRLAQKTASTPNEAAMLRLSEAVRSNQQHGSHRLLGKSKASGESGREKRSRTSSSSTMALAKEAPEVREVTEDEKARLILGHALSNDH